MAVDKKCHQLIYRLVDRSSAYTSGPSYHSTSCSSKNDLELSEQLKDEVLQEVREEVDTKVKVLQDQLDEVKALPCFSSIDIGLFISYNSTCG